MIKKMYIGLHAKYRFFLSDFNKDEFLWTDFSKNSQKVKLIKIRPVGAKLSHVDRQT